jgi:hypothetical protein
MPFLAQEHFQDVPVRLLVVRDKHLDRCIERVFDMMHRNLPGSDDRKQFVKAWRSPAPA